MIEDIGETVHGAGCGTYDCAVIVEDISRRGVEVEVRGGGLVVREHRDASRGGEEEAGVGLEILPCCGRDGDGHELETGRAGERGDWRTGSGRCAWLRAARTADFDLGGGGGEGGGEGEEDGVDGEHGG